MVMIDAFRPIRDLEEEICDYTDAPYCVVVNSCTMALAIVCEWLKVETVTIPRRTYVSVPQSIIRGGGRVAFRDDDWVGHYRLDPYPIWDSARRFTSGMYMPGQYQCLSFHRRKILGYTEGGAILCDDKRLAEIFRRARFDGRGEGIPPKDDDFTMIGWHGYMHPGTAAELLAKLAFLPEHNADMPNDDYPDLSQWDWNAIWTKQKRRRLPTSTI
jgi:dTDP-4-amino-4,6-dideoxygalactose transaminase